jgi:WD40 repeat protein
MRWLTIGFLVLLSICPAACMNPSLPAPRQICAISRSSTTSIIASPTSAAQPPTLKHLERITSANAGSMDELLRLGRGDISEIAILPYGGPLAILRELPQVWDTANWQMIHGLVGPTSPVDTLSWSPDGTLLAIGGSWDPAARVWDVERVLPMLELKGHAEGTRRVLWSPDGTRLLTQGSAGPLRIWGVTQGAAALPSQTQLSSVEPATVTADRQTATPTSRPVEPTRPITIAANEMQWDTSGGGQVTFSIARNGQDYDVHVTSLQFAKRDERLTITPEAAAVYRAITAVPQDQGSISLHAPDEPPRGS